MRQIPTTEKKNPKAGRPPLPEEKRRSVKRTVNLTVAEFEQIRAGAESHGLPIDRFIRSSAFSKGGPEINAEISSSMQEVTTHLNAIASRAAGKGEPLTQGQAAELVDLIQVIIKKLRALRQKLEGLK